MMFTLQQKPDGASDSVILRVNTHLQRKGPYQLTSGNTYTHMLLLIVFSYTLYLGVTRVNNYVNSDKSICVTLKF